MRAVGTYTVQQFEYGSQDWTEDQRRVAYEQERFQQLVVRLPLEHPANRRIPPREMLNISLVFALATARDINDIQDRIKLLVDGFQWGDGDAFRPDVDNARIEYSPEKGSISVHVWFAEDVPEPETKEQEQEQGQALEDV